MNDIRHTTADLLRMNDQQLAVAITHSANRKNVHWRAFASHHVSDRVAALLKRIIRDLTVNIDYAYELGEDKWLDGRAAWVSRAEKHRDTLKFRLNALGADNDKAGALDMLANSRAEMEKWRVLVERLCDVVHDLGGDDRLDGLRLRDEDGPTGTTVNEWLDWREARRDEDDAREAMLPEMVDA